MTEPLIPKHGGCRKRKSFQIAERIVRRCATADDVARWAREALVDERLTAAPSPPSPRSTG